MIFLGTEWATVVTKLLYEQGSFVESGNAAHDVSDKYMIFRFTAQLNCSCLLFTYIGKVQIIWNRWNIQSQHLRLWVFECLSSPRSQYLKNF